MKSKGLKLQNITRITALSRPRNWRFGLCLLSLMLAGCASDEAPGGVELGAAFNGAAVADEPLAAEAAVDILRQGGSAADAAVAAYFTLAVTYPSAATLGGGGVCMVNDWSTGEVHSLSFLAPRPATAGSAFRATAVPANVRGMAALHARYGDLDWRVLLAPAERIARFGAPLTRASARAYDSNGAILASQWQTAQIFVPGGALPREGDKIEQTDLAATIAALRLNGAGAFYSGAFADRLVAAVREAGGSLSQDDLRNLVPVWQAAQRIRFGNDYAYVAAPPAGAGLVAGQMWEMFADGKRYRKARSGERLHLQAETSRLAWQGRVRWLADDGTKIDLEELLSTETARRAMKNYDKEKASGSADGAPIAPASSGDPSSTGFVVLDVLGGAVACEFTAYSSFGTGAVAPGTGILMAPAPEDRHRNPPSLGPMMVFNPRVRSLKFVAVGGPGLAGATAMATVAGESIMSAGQLETAIARVRVHANAGAAVYIESGASDEAKAGLADRGHDVVPVPSFGRVNAIFCPPGFPAEPTKVLCWAESDPRAHGLAAFP